MIVASGEIPEKAGQLAERVGCTGSKPLRHVDLRQTGQMRQDAASTWTNFDARQRIELTTCAFEWKARIGPLGLIRVTDAFGDGSGRLAVSLFGLIPIGDAANSANLDRGELMRYLAELAWAPDAIQRNRTLQWRTLDERRLIVAAGDGARRAEVQVTLDQEGRIGEVFAPDRPRTIGNRFVPCAWRGRFSDYRWFENRLLPTSAEVAWLSEYDDEPVWRGRLTAWSAT